MCSDNHYNTPRSDIAPSASSEPVALCMLWYMWIQPKIMAEMAFRYVAI